jgi:NitT/TauT family transport system ATP-binding protein
MPLDGPALRLHDVSFAFPGGRRVLEEVSLEIPSGAFFSLVGPSGCGKTTLLNLMAGLRKPVSGRVEIEGELLTALNRRAGYMFQQDALLPWKSVLHNIALGLDFRGAPRAEARRQAREWVERTGLHGFERSFPFQLSGGMRKRAAMAQCWIVEPEIVLMDEPFGALDVHTRLRMESEILELWARTGKTVVFVTHDLDEAIALADTVAVLSAGPSSRVAGLYEIGLPRPRNLIDIRTERSFQDIYERIWHSLRGEVLKSYEREPR